MSDDTGQARPMHAVNTAWGAEIPDEQWAVYKRVIRAAREQGLRFVLGGAFGLAMYTGRWRNTKDMDMFIMPADRDAAVAILDGLGLQDYFEQMPYDRAWIYRSVEGEIIVDVIWMMANQRAEVDAEWLSRGPEVEVRGERVGILPPEMVIWNKLYIIHRDRCDWTDVFNLMYTTGPTLDWQHLLDRLGEDALLLSGALSVFAWLCPGRAAMFPAALWERLHLPQPRARTEVEVDQQRVDLLDSRPWFMPILPPEVEPGPTE